MTNPKTKSKSKNYDVKIPRDCEIFRNFQQWMIRKGHQNTKAGILSAMDQISKPECTCQEQSPAE